MEINIFETKNKYQAIYADPPWEYKKSGGKKNSRGMAKQHYNTMPLEEIKNLPIKDITEENAILFMWCTYPRYKEGLEVIEAWGFDYYGLGFEWVKKTKNGKDHFGMGYWTRANPEPCLMAIKGKMKPLRHDIPQLIYAPLMEHSRKPDIARDNIVKLCGNIPRIELFARQTSDDWDCWGNQVGILDYKALMKE